LTFTLPIPNRGWCPASPADPRGGPGSVLAVAVEGEIRLIDANGRMSRTIEVPAGIVVSSQDSPMYFPQADDDDAGALAAKAVGYVERDPVDPAVA
jgi:hypothetical protein